ncbi:MAG: trypsin-like serine protease, partial [Actinomycetota bacterium]
MVGGAPVHMAGWGRTAAGGISPTATLQEATAPLISNADCTRDFRAPSLADGFDPVSMLCAYDLPAGIGVCSCDSGGPLALTIAGTRTLIGVTSWVQMPCASG